MISYPVFFYLKSKKTKADTDISPDYNESVDAARENVAYAINSLPRGDRRRTKLHVS